MCDQNYELFDAVKDANDYLRLSQLTLLPAGQEAYITISTIKVIRWVAAGSTGQIYEGRTRTGAPVAIKVIICPKGIDAEYQAGALGKTEIAVAEAPRIKNLRRSANVVRLLGYGDLVDTELPESLLVEMNVGKVFLYEWCNAGDIDTFISNMSKARKFAPEGLIWKWLIEIVGVADLLSRPLVVDGQEIVEMIHDDIKPDNVFLTFPDHSLNGNPGWPSIRVGDFGFAKAIASKNRRILTKTGRGPHTSPQWPVKSIKSELFEFVHVIYMICTFNAPARPRDLPKANPTGEVFNMWRRYSQRMLDTPNHPGVKVWRIPTIYTGVLQGFFEHILVEDPKRRPTAQEALQTLKDLGAYDRAEEYVPIGKEAFMDYAQSEAFWAK